MRNSQPRNRESKGRERSASPGHASTIRGGAVSYQKGVLREQAKRKYLRESSSIDLDPNGRSDVQPHEADRLDIIRKSDSEIVIGHWCAATNIPIKLNPTGAIELALAQSGVP